MSYTSHQDRGTKAPKSSWLITLLITLVALVAVGCGDSNEDYVYTGTGPNVGPTGNVTFLFEQATPVAAKIVAPADARFVKFTFFNKDGVAVLKDVDNRAYAASITVANVPVSATSYKIDFFAANGTTAVGTPYTGNVTVEAGKTTIVDPSVGPQPVLQSIDVTPSSFTLALNGTKTQQLKVTANYSGNVIQDVTNGSTFASSAAAIASVNTAGLVTAVAAGDATVTATFGNFTDTAAVKVVAGEDPVPPVGELVANPTSVLLTNGTTTQQVKASYDGEEVTAWGTLTNLVDVTAADLSYDNATGNVTSTNAVNGTATLTLTYQPAAGVDNVTRDVPVKVEFTAPPAPEPGAARIEVSFGALENVNAISYAVGSNTAVATVKYFAAGATTGVILAPAAYTVEVADKVPAGNAIAWNAGTGVVDSGALNNTAVVKFTHNPAPGVVLTKNVTATVVASVEVVSAELVSVAGGEALRLVPGITYPLIVQTVTSDGKPNFATGGTSAGQVSLASSDDTKVTVNVGTRTITAVSAGTSSVTVVRNLTGGATEEVATIAVTVANTELAVAPNVTIHPSATTVEAGKSLPYAIRMTYVDGTNQDITPVWNVTSISPARLVPSLVGGTLPVSAILEGVFQATAGAAATVNVAAPGTSGQLGFAKTGGVAFGAAPAIAISVTAAP